MKAQLTYRAQSAIDLHAAYTHALACPKRRAAMTNSLPTVKPIWLKRVTP